MNIPDFENRTPEEILFDINYFDSAGRVFKALSWLDLAKKTKNVSALEYAALETRLATEQLVFEQLVVGVGSRLDQTDYKKCKGDIDQLSKVINRLIPKYEKLVDFTIAISSPKIPITKWDNKRLNSYRGRLSQYLHWSGGLDETVESDAWFKKGIELIKDALDYLWNGLLTGNTGVINLKKLEPEILQLWELYSNDQITLDDIVIRVEILDPALQLRLYNKVSPPTE